MARLSFEEGRKEIISLLQAGKEEFDGGNQFGALSILLEAQCALNEMLQNEMEKTGPDTEIPSADVGLRLLH
jgi:hypothetical protein